MRFLASSPFVVVVLSAASAGLLAALHLIRTRPERRVVPTLLFWREAALEARARTLGGTLRHLATWAFLTGLMSLGIIAWADPGTDASEARTSHCVCVFDASPTLAIQELDGRTRCDVLKAELLRWVRGRPLKDRIAVLEAGAATEVLATFEDARPFLANVIGALEPGEVRVPLEPLLERARDLLRGRSRPRVILFSDRTPELPGPLEEAPELELRTIGAAVDDAGILAAGWRDHLRVRVAGQGNPTSRTLRVLEADGRTLLASREIPAGSFEDRWWVLEGVPARGQGIVVELLPEDAYPSNDRLLTRAPSRGPFPVWIAPELADTARVLFGSDDHVRLVSTADAADVAIVPGTAGPSREGRLRGLRGAIGASDDARMPPRWKGATLAPRSGATVLLEVLGLPVAQRVGTAPVHLEIAKDFFAPRSPHLRNAPSVAGLLGLLRSTLGATGSPSCLRRGEVLLIPLPETPDLAFHAAFDDGTSSPLLFGPPSGVRVALATAPGPRIVGTELERFATSLELMPAPEGLVGSPPTETTRHHASAEPAFDLRPWEWIVLALVGLVLIDAWIHARGRIP